MGATSDVIAMEGAGMFQSSPTPKDGCNLGQGVQRAALLVVSILTHPEGWVQPTSWVVASFTTLFQSSPTPKDGCNDS